MAPKLNVRKTLEKPGGLFPEMGLGVGCLDQINQTGCRTDSTAKSNFIWANISTSITGLLQGQLAYNERKLRLLKI